MRVGEEPEGALLYSLASDIMGPPPIGNQHQMYIAHPNDSYSIPLLILNCRLQSTDEMCHIRLYDRRSKDFFFQHHS